MNATELLMPIVKGALIGLCIVAVLYLIEILIRHLTVRRFQERGWGMKFKKHKEPKITMEDFAKLCAEPIDWEQRRYEVAKAMMPVIYSKYWDENDDSYSEMIDSHFDEKDENGIYYLADDIVAKESIYLADLLIKFLKL